MKLLKMQDMVCLETLKTYYDNDSVRIYANDGEKYRIKMTELFKCLNSETEFKIVKKSVHKYLVVVENGKNIQH